MNYPPHPDRYYDLGALRRRVMTAALEMVSNHINGDPATVTPIPADFDEACKALADKLREPETCWACGQEKHA